MPQRNTFADEYTQNEQDSGLEQDQPNGGLRLFEARVLHRDRREETRIELSSAIILYCTMEMTFWLQQAEAALSHAASSRSC